MGPGLTISHMDPITAVTSTWTIAKTAGEISKKLYEFGKSLKDRELKQQVDEILDGVRELKQSASQLEDENRELREKLRFKGDDYEFRTPFYYEKSHQDRPLCPKCFAKNIPSPMENLSMQASNIDVAWCAATPYKSVKLFDKLRSARL